MTHSVFSSGATTPEVTQEIVIYRHISEASSLKNKVSLHKNLVSLLTSGEKILYLADRKLVIDPQHFVIAACGNCLMTEKRSGAAPYSSTLLLFDTVAYEGFLLKHAALLQQAGDTPQQAWQPVLILEKDSVIRKYIESLNLLIQNDATPSPTMRLLKFEELMLHLLEKYPQAIASFKPGQQTHPDEVRIKKVVEANLFNDTTLEDLAFLCNLSLSTFKRRFAGIYNTSPNKYFLQRRLEQAALLLATQAASPSEVYYQVGYKNHSSFSQSFKRAYGVCPKDYRGSGLTG